MKKLLVVCVMLALSQISWAWKIGEPTTEMVTNSDGLMIAEKVVNDEVWRANLRLFDPEFMKNYRSLAGDGIITLGFEGDAGYAATVVDSKFASALHAEVNILVNHRLKIGVVGQALGTGISATEIIGTTTNSGKVSLGYGVFSLGYIFMPEKLLHFSVFAGFGGGVMTLNSDYSSGILNDPNKTQMLYPVMAAQFGAEAELNLAKMLKMKLGAGYRMIIGATDYNYAGITDARLSGLYGNLSLSLGLF